MSRATQKPKASALTLEEYMATPVTTRRQEVIDGVIRMCPAPTIEHQVVQGDIYLPLRQFVSQHDLGTVLLSPFDLLIRELPKLRTRQPDVAYFSFARVSYPELRQSKYMKIAPELAVEVRSEQESEARWRDKLADYASIGVLEVWRVFLKTQVVEVLSLNNGLYERYGLFESAESVRSRVLTDLALPVASFFP